VIVQVGQDRAEVRRRLAEIGPAQYALLVDAEGRPLGWLDRHELAGTGPIGPEAATPGAPTVQPETTLRDAVSAMLGSSVQLGVVVDERDRVLGLISVDSVGDRLREPVGGADGAVHAVGEDVPAAS
jgi:osmoprotectant transport system ATP-binding protein